MVTTAGGNAALPGADARWLVVRQPRPRPRLRLFCFPHAGGSATSFGPWAGLLSPSVEVCVLEAPGRGARLFETPLTSITDLAAHTLSALRHHLDVPYVLFGQSIGGTVAFELARQLERHGCRPPRLLVVAGSVPPHLTHKVRPIHHLSDREFAAEIRRLGDTPPEVFDDAEMMDALLPGLRADFQAFETYRFRAALPLCIPIWALKGTEDGSCGVEDLHAWGGHTSGGLCVNQFPGGHLFAISHASCFVPVLELRLERSLSIRSG